MPATVFESLKNVYYFSQLPDESLQSLADNMNVKAFRKNVPIISEDDESTSLYILLSGKVRVYLSNEEGKEVTLCFEGPGQYFGELAILDDGPRSASVVAVEHCSCAVISKTIFMEWLSDHPDAQKAIIKGLCQTIRDLTSNVKGLAILDVYGRLIKVLRRMAIHDKGITLVPNRPTQQDLANMVGASREMVTRIFRDLSIGGYIKIEGKSLIISKKLPPSW